MHPEKEIEIIKDMLEHIGVPRDGVLFVHSAFKDFSRDGYDADKVVDTLVKYMSPGTLLLPTMSWRYVKPDLPYFNELKTPSNTGILTEIFRKKHATKRSIHPTHSVAGMGKSVTDILGSHHLSETPCDKNSPFGKLLEYNSYIIMMGVGMDCCSFIHHIEEMIAPDLYVQPVENTELYKCTDREDNEIEVKLRRHLFLPRDFWQFQDMLANENELKVYRCDNAICIGFKVASMASVVRNVLGKSPEAILAKPGQRYRLM